MNIHRLGEADAEAYRIIRLEALRLNPEAYSSSFEIEAGRELDWFVTRLSNSEILGAFLNHRLVGTAGFTIRSGRQECHKATLWGVYVRPSNRGRGIGLKLCEAIINAAVGRVEVLQLAVVSTNLIARHLYSRVGFCEYGIEANARKIDSRYHDDILMCLHIHNPG